MLYTYLSTSIDFQIESSNKSDGYLNTDTSHIYHGDLLGESGSFVFGSVINGVFEGKIVTEKEAYYVENSKHYFSKENLTNSSSHSVIYKESDVDDPYENKRSGHPSGCGINDKVAHWMENIQNSAFNQNEDPIENYDHLFKTHQDSILPNLKFSNKYSREANSIENILSHKRLKRTATREDNKNTCSLYIQTDPLIWRHIREGIADVS